MTRAFRQTLIAYAAALMLAVMGAVSAHHMGPPSEAAIEAAEISALGFEVDDLCGEMALGGAYHCPFCHKLPEPPRLAAPDAVDRLARVILEQRGTDLLRGPQHIADHVTTRAPPRLS
ncbi:hypothetical protein [Oceanicola sp. 502str15]|uniref:hypothetical protein n=1 Tax=Oceanicola sp. 502str15 TaxID=2696061 RepID=UPI0020962833|nr:hypothetical protein [Oceanicola sp. 502str15]MCO6384013.1 hypothetical protein [Oceanicola sp. 502str15]